MKIVFLTAWVGSIGLAMVWFASLLAGYLDVASRQKPRCRALYLRFDVRNGGVFHLQLLLSGCWNVFQTKTLVSCWYNRIRIWCSCPLQRSVAVGFFGRVWMEKHVQSNDGSLHSCLHFEFQYKCSRNTSEVDVESETLDVEQKVETKGRITFYCSVWTFPAYTFVVISITVGSFGMFIPIINLVSIQLFIVQLILSSL